MLGSIERMAIHQTKHTTDLEKRLQLLRRQVYGKPAYQSIGKSADQPTHRLIDMPIHRPANTQISSDLTYLHQDLLKILTFSSLAIGAQAILFFLLKNHILNLNIF